MELLEALKVIRRECAEHSRCQLCPLRSKNDDEACSLKEFISYPEDWVLYGDDSTIPRLFI